MAAKKGTPKMVELLLSLGADPADGDAIYRMTPLHIAASKGRTKIVKILSSTAEMKKLINTENVNQQTPLYLSVFGNRVATFKYLVENGSSLTSTSNQSYNTHFTGNSAFDLACLRGKTKIVKYLLENRASDIDKKDSFPLVAATKRGHIDVLKLLIANSFSTNFTTDYEFGLVQLASQRGHTETLKYLLSVNISPKTAPKTISALRLAINSNHIEVMKILVEDAKVDVDERSPIGGQESTALIGAVETGKFAIVEYLISKGANVHHAASQNGMTPLMCSCDRFPSLEMSKLLISHGANVNDTSFGYTALNRLIENRMHDKSQYALMKYLLDCGANPTVRSSYAFAYSAWPVARELIFRGAGIIKMMMCVFFF